MENLSEFEVQTVSDILRLLTQVTNLSTKRFSLRQLNFSVHLCARTHAFVHICICRCAHI